MNRKSVLKPLPCIAGAPVAVATCGLFSMALALAVLAPSPAAAQAGAQTVAVAPPPASPSVTPITPATDIYATGNDVNGMHPAPLPRARHYTGPSDPGNLTVARLLATGRDDQHVALRGKLVRHMGAENYLFADATGSIQVEIDHARFPYDSRIGADTVVDITGEFDREYPGHSKIDVETIRIVRQ